MDGPIAVIGAGNTGASWAGLFAAHGHTVRIFDEHPESYSRALSRAVAAAHFLSEKRLADPVQVERGVARLSTAESLPDAVREASFIQESVIDDETVKRKIFADISRAAPDNALIATSSSGLSITAIQKDAHLPGRCLAAHPYNPPHLIPLVELAPGEQTHPETMRKAKEFYSTLGKEPVVMSKDVPGYIANRLSAALWREAIELVRSGWATVEEVDTAVSYGPGLRWAVMGPHLIYHLGGGADGIRGHMAHLAATKEGMLKDLATWTVFPPDTADVLASGLTSEIDGKTLEELESERDNAIAEILLALSRARSANAARCSE